MKIARIKDNKMKLVSEVIEGGTIRFKDNNLLVGELVEEVGSSIRIQADNKLVVGELIEGDSLEFEVPSEYELQYLLVKGEVTLAQAKANGWIDDYTVETSCSTKYMNNNSVISFGYIDASRCTSTFRMYRYCENLEAIKYLDCSSTKDISGMFSFCHKIIHCPILDITNLAQSSQPFYAAASLKTVAFYSSAGVPSASDSILQNCGITATAGTIYVPDELLTEWSNAPNWVVYKTRFKPLSERAGDLELMAGI